MGKGRTELKSLDLSSVSSFRKKVYQVLQEIPRGRVTTYGAIAKKLASRRYSRAVGTAVATNPLPLIVPCHRVVPFSLEIGNYGMGRRKPSEGAYIKHGLLEREGVKVLGNKVSKQSLWYPE
jgi:methylated-DNA-[protein]-cysteine S-methyltransferase